MLVIRDWFSSWQKRLISRFVLFPIPKNTERLIVFLTPGFNWRCGGILFIIFHFMETRRITKIHGAHVLLATLPGDPWLLKYTWFRNDNFLVPFEEIALKFRELDWLMVHVPEYAVNQVLTSLSSEQRKLISRTANVHFNVMVQNIDQIEGQQITALQHLGKVTCTTAHPAYCTAAFRQKFGVPLHPLWSYQDPEKYFLTSYEKKEDLLLVSPDSHPLKEQLLTKIQKAYGNLRIQIIKDISYEEYKQLISRAKWSLTFGEGLDGYFAEPTLSGGVGFAVYNDKFFTSEWLALENVYPSWDEFANSIVSDIERLDNSQAYTNCWNRAFDLMTLYGIDAYHEDLKRFYLGDYVFP